MKICHVYRTEEEIPPRLVHHVEILDEMYPKLRIDLVRTTAPPHHRTRTRVVFGLHFSASPNPPPKVTVHAEGFTARVVHTLAEKLHVPQNFMFISCPGENFPEKIAKYGGMRIVTH
jgi:hypothetical protein